MRTLRDFLYAIMGLASALRETNRRMSQMTTAMDNLTAAVANNATVEASAVALIQGLAQQIKDAAASDDSAAVQALADEINANAGKLSAAVASGTPAASAPDAPPTGAGVKTGSAE